MKGYRTRTTSKCESYSKLRSLLDSNFGITSRQCSIRCSKFIWRGGPAEQAGVARPSFRLWPTPGLGCFGGLGSGVSWVSNVCLLHTHHTEKLPTKLFTIPLQSHSTGILSKISWLSWRANDQLLPEKTSYRHAKTTLTDFNSHLPRALPHTCTLSTQARAKPMPLIS